MVKAPEHEDELEADKREEAEESNNAPPSHPTKDSQDRDKAAKTTEKFGNEWKSADAGA